MSVWGRKCDAALAVELMYVNPKITRIWTIANRLGANRPFELAMATCWLMSATSCAKVPTVRWLFLGDFDDELTVAYLHPTEPVKGGPIALSRSNAWANFGAASRERFCVSVFLVPLTSPHP